MIFVIISSGAEDPISILMSRIITDTVSVDEDLISLESRDSREIKSSSTETVSVMIRDIKIEIGSSAPDEMITKIIKAVRYA